MGRKAKQAYREAIFQRYRKANRAEKKQILDEFCAVCGYNRKYAIRLLNSGKNRKKHGKRGRKSPYCSDPLFMSTLHAIWQASDYMCSSRLKAAIPLWLPGYAAVYGEPTTEVGEKLLNISLATLDRVLAPERKKWGKGRTGTKPGTMLRNQIPIRTSNWDISRPGYMDADTVAHCGNSLAGDFVWSLTMADIQTEWTECRAVWNKGAGGVLDRIKEIVLMPKCRSGGPGLEQ